MNPARSLGPALITGQWVCHIKILKISQSFCVCKSISSIPFHIFENVSTYVRIATHLQKGQSYQSNLTLDFLISRNTFFFQGAWRNIWLYWAGFENPHHFLYPCHPCHHNYSPPHPHIHHCHR